MVRNMKRVLMTLCLLTCTCMTVFFGETAMAAGKNMGILRLNLTSSVALSGLKKNAFMNSMIELDGLGIIKRGASGQRFDLDLDGNDDIGYSAIISSAGEEIILHTVGTNSVGSKELVVPEATQEKLAAEGKEYCQKIFFTFAGDTGVAAAVGITEGGGFIYMGTERDYAMNMTLEQGMSITITCAPKENYKFVGWYEGIITAPSYYVTDNTGKLLSTEKDYVLSTEREMIVQAVYEKSATQTPAITQERKQNTLSVKGKTVKLSVKKVKKKKQVIAVKKAMTVKGAQGTVSYKLVSVTKSKFKKKFSVDAKTGKITVKKGTKKGTYTLKIKVKAKGNASYLAGEKTVKVKVKIS